MKTIDSTGSRRTEWFDADGWKHVEVHALNGQLLESGVTSPDGAYSQYQLHYAISAKAIDEHLYGP